MIAARIAFGYVLGGLSNAMVGVAIVLAVAALGLSDAAKKLNALQKEVL